MLSSTSLAHQFDTLESYKNVFCSFKINGYDEEKKIMQSIINTRNFFSFHIVVWKDVSAVYIVIGCFWNNCKIMVLRWREIYPI